MGREPPETEEGERGEETRKNETAQQCHALGPAAGQEMTNPVD